MRKVLAITILFAVISAVSGALCEDGWGFILCNPKTPVNVRTGPKSSSTASGWLDFGDRVETDGKRRNGYLHVLGVTEAGEGWVHAGYVVEDPPREVNALAYIAATGRVRAYNRIGGRRVAWLSVGAEVRVLAVSDEWAVTTRGYVMTKYLEGFYE